MRSVRGGDQDYYTRFRNVIFKIFRDMSRKGYCMTISRRNKSTLLRDYFTREQTDCEQTMRSSCLKNKPHMVTGTKGDTPELGGGYL